MISCGIEIAIAEGVEEMVRLPLGQFSFFLFFFRFFYIIGEIMGGHMRENQSRRSE